MSTSPVRISEQASKTLDDLSRRLKRSKRQILDEALQRYEGEVLLRQAGQSMRRLRDDPKRWKAYQGELDQILDMAAPMDDEP